MRTSTNVSPTEAVWPQQQEVQGHILEEVVQAAKDKSKCPLNQLCRIYKSTQKNRLLSQVVVAHAFNLRTQKVEANKSL